MTGKREISFDKSIPYHIVNRAVEKKKIFLKEEDCYRFVFQMYAANIGRPIHNLNSRQVVKAAQAILNGEEIPKDLIIVEHPPLVYTLSFALVVDHHHFIFIQNAKGAISKYQQKLNTGFAMYHNLKYDHEGNLFSKPYKIVPIKTNFQLDAVLRYANVKNPLDVFQPGWQENGLRNEKEAFKFLNEYQFSSFPDIFGKRHSKILAPKEILEKYLGKEITESKTEFLNFLKDYLKNKERLSQYRNLLLED